MDQHLWDGMGCGSTPVIMHSMRLYYLNLEGIQMRRKTSNFKVGELEEIVLKKKVDKLSEEV